MFLSRILVGFFLNVYVLPAFGQVVGISNSKLTAYNDEAIPAKTFEFEPAIGIFWASKAYDNDGNLNDLYSGGDSINVTSEFLFRLTYGVVNNLEMGFFVPSDISAMGFGAKYKFYGAEKIGLAGLAGLNLARLNKEQPKKQSSPDYANAVSGGLVSTFYFNEDFSLDANLILQKRLGQLSPDHKVDLFVFVDAGYYVFEKGLQLIASLNYFNHNYDDKDGPELYSNELLFLNLGATIERHKNFVLIVNSPISLYGKNQAQVFGFNFAVTIAID